MEVVRTTGYTPAPHCTGSSMDRASDYGSEGSGFESLPVRHQVSSLSWGETVRRPRRRAGPAVLGPMHSIRMHGAATAWTASGRPTGRRQRDKWVVRVEGVDTDTGKPDAVIQRLWPVNRVAPRIPGSSRFVQVRVARSSVTVPFGVLAGRGGCWWTSEEARWRRQIGGRGCEQAEPRAGEVRDAVAGWRARCSRSRSPDRARHPWRRQWHRQHQRALRPKVIRTSS